MKKNNFSEQLVIFAFAVWLTASCTVGSLVILKWLILISIKYGF